MRKRLFTIITVLALAVSAMGMTVFADEMEENVPSTEMEAATDTVTPEETTEEEPVTDTYTDALITAKYVVDITWSPMGGMMTPVLDIDAEADTFDVYNKTAPETSKGAGTITFDAATGEYTLVYENGNTTTFTYNTETDEITFTSKLWYGKASFDSAGEDGVFVPYTGTRLVYADTLETGKYAVDISWSPMGTMMAPVVDVDADEDVFDVYNKTAPETSKGAGTIEFDKYTGEYTLIYENGNTTTFTYDAEADEITFTSKLWYGKASFDSAGEDGVFVPYKATLLKEEESTTEDTTVEENTTEDTTVEENMTEDATTEENTGDVVTGADKAPDTADNTQAAFYAFTAVAALGAAVVLTKKRNA